MVRRFTANGAGLFSKVWKPIGCVLLDSPFSHIKNGKPRGKVCSTVGLSMPMLIWMGRSFPEWSGAQVALNTKNRIPFVSTLLQHFCHGPEYTSTALTLLELHCLEKGNGNHIPKIQMPFPLVQECFYWPDKLDWQDKPFPSLYFPPQLLLLETVERFFMCCLAFLCTTQEDTGGACSLPQLPRNWICCWEFNYREQSTQQTEKWRNVVSEEQRCGIAEPLILRVTLHVHPLAKGFVTYGMILTI